MAPTNTRAETNHKEPVEGDSIYNLQQHMTPSTFIPLRDHALGATPPSSYAPLGGHPRTHLPMHALTEVPQH